MTYIIEQNLNKMITCNTYLVGWKYFLNVHLVQFTIHIHQVGDLSKEGKEIVLGTKWRNLLGVHNVPYQWGSRFRSSCKKNSCNSNTSFAWKKKPKITLFHYTISSNAAFSNGVSLITFLRILWSIGGL
jgi:hypothetical protein